MIITKDILKKANFYDTNSYTEEVIDFLLDKKTVYFAQSILAYPILEPYIKKSIANNEELKNQSNYYLSGIDEFLQNCKNLKKDDIVIAYYFKKDALSSLNLYINAKTKKTIGFQLIIKTPEAGSKEYKIEKIKKFFKINYLDCGIPAPSDEKIEEVKQKVQEKIRQDEEKATGDSET